MVQYMLLLHVEKGEHNKIFKTILTNGTIYVVNTCRKKLKKQNIQDDINVRNKMKHDLTTGTWQDDTGCPISIVLAATSDESSNSIR